MAKYRFTATHGVQFSPDGTDVIAHFVHDSSLPERDSVNYKKTYVFETDDAKVAAEVRKLAKADDSYGIQEDKSNDDGE